MRVLVCGGAGFIGSHLCARLVRDGAHVLCLDNFYTGARDNLVELVGHPRFELREGDVVDLSPDDGLAVERIYNLACPASPVHYQRDPVRTLHTSVLGATRVLELARRSGARVLQASTSEVYGDPAEHPQRETYWGHVNPIGPRACYDEGKRAAETLFFDYHRQYAVDIRVARIFNTYGPRMQENDGRVVSNFVVQALRGAPLTVYGDGAQTRSFCYVDDLVEGLVRLMEHPGVDGPVNLGNPEEVSVGELARRVRALVPAAGPIEQRPLPSDDPTRRCPDITRAERVLGWRPSVSLDIGLPATVEYFRQRLQQ